MSQTSPVSESSGVSPESLQSQPENFQPEASTPASPPPSYVKLAMRNMVRKGGKSLYHFALTTIGLLALLVGLAYLTR